MNQNLKNLNFLILEYQQKMQILYYKIKYLLNLQFYFKAF